MTDSDHKSFYGAWLDGLRKLNGSDWDTLAPTAESSVGSSFGYGQRKMAEMLAHLLVVRNPRTRTIVSASRPMDVGYAIALVIWALSGTDDSSLIRFYNPHADRFADDRGRLAGALGPRVFGSGALAQLKRCQEELTKDRNSRRAFIALFSPSDLARTHERDVPCWASLHFLVRNETLECIAHMRSQSALKVLPYDVFLLSMIHEMLAVQCNLRLGAYRHLSNSFHVYADERMLLDEVLEEDGPSQVQMDPIDDAEEATLSRVVSAEADIRSRLLTDCRALIPYESYGLSPYWGDMVVTMAAFVRLRLGGTELLDPLPVQFLEAWKIRARSVFNGTS